MAAVRMRNVPLQWKGNFANEENLKNMSRHLNYKNTVCYTCCGFYGPCFGQPVCSTCHAFLFPEDINHPDIALYQEKSDSEDSGNEEPSDFYETLPSRQDRPRTQRIVITTLKIDKLTECISALSCPRKKDSIFPDGLGENLPAEVLAVIFSYLDDLSLWCCGQVCKRWRQVMEVETTQEQWKCFVQRQWPLFKPLSLSPCWRTLYTKLVESAPCLLCLHQMSEQTQPPPIDNSWRTVRLKNELKSLQSDPPEGIDAKPLDKTCCHWQASITGPIDSPYEGGRFFLYLQIPQSYPMKPPVVRFITKIFHPNISRHGDIGIDSIHHNWTLALTISKVLISIQSLLTDPYCHVCMEPEIGRLYVDDRNTFDRTARLWTMQHATHGKIMLPSTDKESFWLSPESG